jgi:hypothetical protein
MASFGIMPSPQPSVSRSHSSGSIRPLPPLPGTRRLPLPCSVPPTLIQVTTPPTFSRSTSHLPRPLPVTPGPTPTSTSSDYTSFLNIPSRAASNPTPSCSSFKSQRSSRTTPISSRSASPEEIALSSQCVAPPSSPLMKSKSAPLRSKRQLPKLQIITVPIPSVAPLSPITPAQPSPSTSRRRRVSRLKRRLGEDIPESMVTIRPIASSQSTSRKAPQSHILVPPVPVPDSHPSDDEWEDLPEPPPKSPSKQASIALVSCTPVSLTKEDSQRASPARRKRRESKPPFLTAPLPEGGNLHFVFKWPTKFSAAAAKRRSAKWVQIKRGKVVESDYSDVISALRRL